MDDKIIVVPGEPNDSNRDYLPPAIKGSLMVVNENGNNSQTFPERLIEYKDIIVDDSEDIWYEYVPENYDQDKKTPLVFSMHGGLMTGWGQAIYTSWTKVADREGFICVFPNAHENRFWMIECDPDKIAEITTPANGIPGLNVPIGEVEEFHDVRVVVALLERMKKKYNIDEDRIYIQGMSMGNCMTSQVARYLGNLFAAAAGSACPTNCKLLFNADGTLINKGGPLDIWQSRLQHDKTPWHYDMDDREVVLGNLEYWKRLNGCSSLPQIKIIGEKNLVFYQGIYANVTLMDVFNRDHGQTLDDAQMVWNYMFSSVRRCKTGIEHTKPVKDNSGDKYAVAVTSGTSKAWVNNHIEDMGTPAFIWKKLKYHGLNGDAIVRGEYLMVSIAFIAQMFEAAYLEKSEGESVEICLKNGRSLQFARGCIGCVIDNDFEAMLCEAVMYDGKLCISLEWFCSYLYNMHVSEFDGVLYATDHYAKISRYTAWVLKDIL